MTDPYYVDPFVTLWLGDSLEVLRTLPDASVDCCVTSPPYFGLRDYGVDGQMGAESSPAEYVAGMRAVFAEVRRVLADDGTLWLNLGDSYSSDPGNGRGRGSALQGRKHFASGGGAPTSNQRKPGVTLARKNMLGVPWRTAFALQDDGWILRNDIIWAKTNPMPSSVTDRVNSTHEHIFMMSKSPRYWFDLDPIRREARSTVDAYRKAGASIRENHAFGAVGGSPVNATSFSCDPNPLGANPGDVWMISTRPFPEAHFAVFPHDLPQRCILAGCKPGGTVLDPFSGSGTTGMVAKALGRRYVGIDLKAEYLDLSLSTRLVDYKRMHKIAPERGWDLL